MLDRTFNTNSADGMLDVILGCTLIFLLLTALVQVDRAAPQETALPDLDLSSATAVDRGATAVSRRVISIASEGGQPRYWLDDAEVAPADLPHTLAALAGAHVALRRDRTAPVAWEDDVIVACRDAGVDRIAIMIETKEKDQ